MKKLTLLLFFFLTNYCFSQETKSIKIKQATLKELKSTVYKNDSAASAVVLYEHSNFYLSNRRKVKFTTENYYRIKILTKEGLEKGTFSFGMYKKDKISEIKAITYNISENDSILTSSLKEDEILRNKINDDFTEIILNLPNVKVGSVIEIKYSVVSSNPNIDTWFFQSDIPKVRSEIHTSVPKYIDHMVLLKGTLELSKKKFTNGKKCFPDQKKGDICNYTMYRMDSIPKFKEELFMPDPSSLVSRLRFKLSRYNKKGFVPYYMMRFWFQFDNAYEAYLLKNEKAKKSFFKKIVPDSIKKGENKLEIAKNIYSFVQNHYTWNGFKGGDSKYRFRKRSKKKSGSLNLINISLYNSLQALGIESYYVILSTRGYGLPERAIPEFENFNYTLVKTIIDGKEYFLDAANKKLAFGNLSPKTLNGEARVLNFEGASDWEKLKPKDISTKNSVLNVSFDDEMNLEGKMLIRREGINAYLTRQEYVELSEEKYLEGLEDRISNISIDNFNIKNLDNLDKTLVETQEIFMDSEDLNTEIDSENLIRFSPVFFDQLSINPFKSNERLFELDFNYQRKNIYRLSIKIPDNYKVIKLPKNLGLKLPNDGGSYIYKISNINNKINLYIKFYIEKDLFSTEEYFYLKELYEQIIQAESAYIELQKIEK
jgi:hypothetical protein